MSRNSFVISDTHFSHTNSWEKFKKSDGTPLRPFTSTEEMDETMVERWNAVVKPQDHVYHCGDVAIARKGLEFVKRLNGHKRLIMGNHDPFDNKYYYEAGFEKLCGVRVFVDKWILSHIPLHPSCVTERFRCNVHGHTHSNEVMRSVPKFYSDGQPGGQSGYEMVEEPDPRFISVCVEQPWMNFTPISFEDLELKIQERWKQYGYEPPKNAGWGNGSSPD